MQRTWTAILALALSACNGPPREQAARDTLCDSARIVGRLPAEITEASGVAAGRRTPGILWVHNDGRVPVLFALDSTGVIKARVRVAGVSNVDWEDIAAAPCGDTYCLFIGDIGDNVQIRRDRAIYRVVEPLLTDSVTHAAVRFPFHLPGRSEDAEALIAMPDGRMYIVTKGRSGPITIFAFPAVPTPDLDVELRPVHTLSGGLVQLPDMVTGAAATPDGRFVAIRTYSAFKLFRLSDERLEPIADSRTDLVRLAEPQGEGIDITAEGTVWLVSEQGLENQPAPIARVQCRLADARSEPESH